VDNRGSDGTRSHRYTCVKIYVKGVLRQCIFGIIKICLLFCLRFCSEKYNESLHMYEITIGGSNNQQSSIRRCRQQSWSMATNHTPLSEAGFQSFWMTWISNVTQKGLTIRVGIGGVQFVNEFLFLHDPEPCDVNYIGVSTGYESVGTWIFLVGKFTCSNVSNSRQKRSCWQNRLPKIALSYSLHAHLFKQ